MPTLPGLALNHFLNLLDFIQLRIFWGLLTFQVSFPISTFVLLLDLWVEMPCKAGTYGSREYVVECVSVRELGWEAGLSPGAAYSR